MEKYLLLGDRNRGGGLLDLGELSGEGGRNAWKKP